MNAMAHFRSAFLAVLASLFTAVFWSSAASGQTFPTQPIKLIVPYPAGGGTDIVARILGQELTKAWGQPVIVQNMAGATGSVGTGAAARSEPDGYTILIVPNSHAISAALNPKLPYDSVKGFEAITLVTSYPYVLVVNPALTVLTAPELFAYAKANPSQALYASSGNGTAGHLSMELLLSAASVTMTHVPYKGSTPALLDLVGGRVPTMFDPAATVIPLIKGGKLRAVAVSTAKRFGMLPDVPTIAEATSIKDFDVPGWLGILAPANTPKAIVDRYHAELVRILQIPAVRQSLERSGQEPQHNTPQAFRAMMVDEIAKWTKVIQVAKISLTN